MTEKTSFNRRQLLVGSAALPVLASANVYSAAANHSHHSVKGKPFDPSNEPKRVRKNFYDLTDAELRTFMTAVGYARNNLKLLDPLQWDNYAKLHALHCTEADDDHPAVHWSWHFLPWHRGYLYFLERILDDCLKKAGVKQTEVFALPYWDWSTHRTMPNTREREQKGLASPFFGYNPALENMVNDDGLGFDNSALYDGNRGPSISKPEMDPKNERTPDSKIHVSDTLYYTSQDYISLILSLPWEHFGGGTVVDRQTGQGLLEQGPHNDVHDWVGSRFGKNRTMGTLRNAAADPMFYMHHGNIDRIFSLYNQPMPDLDGEWGQFEYNFLDIDGSTLTLSIKDIMTKTTNVSYAGGFSPSVPRRLKKAVKSAEVEVNKVLGAKPLNITIPESTISSERMILEVVTGTINNTGKYKIAVEMNGQTVGRVRWLDGEHRSNYKSTTHSFSVLLVNAPNTTTIRLVPPKKGTFDILIKSLRFTVV